MTPTRLICITLQEYELENDENNAALSRMRNALVNEADEAQKAQQGN